MDAGEYVMLKVKFFTSLRHPSFRLLFSTMVLSSICMGMQDPLIAWLTLRLTDSPLLFSAVLSLRFAPYLFGPMTGVIADRVNRRKLIIIFKVTNVAFTATLGTLIIGGQIQLWHVAVIILLQSIISTFNMPAQSALIADLVGKEDITNATALNRIFMDESNLIGSFFVGAFVDYVGVGVFYYLNALIYSASIIPILMIRGVPDPKIKERESFGKNLVDGFKYSWKNRPVFGGELMYFITNVFLWPIRRTMMYAFAQNVLHADASGLGWISTGSKLGDFAVTAVVAQLGSVKKKGRVIVLSSLAWGAAWTLFSTSTSLPFALICLFAEGIACALTMTMTDVILMVNSEPEMRGRVMGIRSFATSSQFPSSIVAGAMAQAWGDSFAVGLEGILFVASMLVIIKVVPSLRKTD